MQQIVPPAVKIVTSERLPTLQVNELVSAQPVQSASITISQTRLLKGGKSPHHNHPEEELIVVISGLRGDVGRWRVHGRTGRRHCR